MHKNVEILLGRLATDESFRTRFAAGPAEFLRDLTGRGATDALALLAAALDPRIRRAPQSAIPSETLEKES